MATLMYEQPAHYKKYESLFGTCLIFKATANKIVLKKSDFYQPLVSANAYLRDVLQECSEHVQLSLAGSTSTAAKIKQLPVSDLAAYSIIDQCLSALHMSRATVYRKLKEEGTTFTELVKQARLETLSKLKSHHKSADEMASLLGFRVSVPITGCLNSKGNLSVPAVTHYNFKRLLCLFRVF